ncbi:MAG: TolC family protein [bacterium]|nr:TolC family protein [bacterium]
MRQLLIVLFVLLAVPAGADDVLTAEQAIALGLERNFQIRIARQQVETSRIDRGQGRAALLPDLSASGGYQRGWSDVESDSPGTIAESESEQLSGNLLLNWTIFDGLEMFTTRKRYEQLAVRGEQQLRATIEQEVAAISLAYHNLVLQRQLLAAAAENLTVSEARLDQNRVRRDLGGVSETDLLLAQVARNTDRAAWLEQELLADHARRELNLLLGNPEGDDLVVVTDIPANELTMDDEQILTRVMAANSALNLARQGTALAGFDVSSARSAYWPRLTLNSSWGYSDRTVSPTTSPEVADLVSESRDLSVGLTLSISIFDGYRKRMNLQRAKVNRRIAGLEEERVQRDLTARVTEVLSIHRQRLTLVDLAASNESAARRSLALQEQLVEAGVSTSLEFRDAQVSYSRARSSHLQARFQACSTYIEIRRLAGLLLE